MGLRGVEDALEVGVEGVCAVTDCENSEQVSQELGGSHDGGVGRRDVASDGKGEGNSRVERGAHGETKNLPDGHDDDEQREEDAGRR